jgi:DNA-binding transcriptional MerR regulator
MQGELMAPPDGDPRRWSVSELAEEFGITTRTLRFYESLGLIAPQRNGTARSYDHRDRTRLMLILRGKRFGMSLEESREIVDMYDGARSGEIRQLQTWLGRLGDIAVDLEARKTDLDRTLTEIAEVVQRCRERLEQLT